MSVRNLINSELVWLRDQFLSQGFDLRFVGGCVRDTLAGQQPKDIDLCTDARPEQQVAIYQQYNVRYIPTGVGHGTYTVVLADKLYEITSLRRDVSTDGRRATVAFTSDWTEDLARRDFTINAMQLTFDNQLVDPFGGHKDLLNGVVKFVGDPETRIKEDHLRILRWYRFVARFDKAKQSPSVAVTDDSVIKSLSRLSRERIWQELQLILNLPNWYYILQCMWHDGIFKALVPTMGSLAFHGYKDQQAERSLDIVARLCMFFGPRVALELLAHLKASNSDIKKAHLFDEWVSTKIKPRWLLVNGHSKYLVKEYCILTNVDEFELAVLDSWDPPVFPISGSDLLACGITQGPLLGDWLGYLKDAWIQSNFTLNRDELLKRVR